MAASFKAYEARSVPEAWKPGSSGMIRKRNNPHRRPSKAARKQRVDGAAKDEFREMIVHREGKQVSGAKKRKCEEKEEEGRSTPKAEVPQRRHEAAPAGSDVIRATGPSRSHFRCPELESRSRRDVSQRSREVTRVFCDWERRDQSDSAKSLAFWYPGLENRSRSDVSQRPREVARVFCRSERRLAATT
ncbi:hypothetical protein YC2023_117803 [Brassica napus]